VTITRTISMTTAAVLIAASLNTANSADMAHAVLKDKQGKDVGHVELTATNEGVRLRVSLKGVPAGERAFHIHESGQGETRWLA
jgi:Cu-Zn family superoxide dismutase